MTRLARVERQYYIIYYMHLLIFYFYNFQTSTSAARTMEGVRIFVPTRLALTNAAASRDEFLQVTREIV